MNKSINQTVSLRFAEPGDIGLVLQFIKDLAEFEKLSHEVVATEKQLAQSLFGPRPECEVVLAFAGEKAVGFALFFHNYSTFMSRKGLYLEDLFVKPEARGMGVGKLLLQFLARLAVERGCGRLEWWVLDWNTKAIDFYKSLGARPMDDWTVFRVDGKNLDALSAGFKR